jgi:hypothetical protein
MLDTVLNLGLHDESVLGLARVTGNERFAWDSYGRFVQMLGNVSRGIPGELFETAIAAAKAERGVSEDTEIDASTLDALLHPSFDSSAQFEVLARGVGWCAGDGSSRGRRSTGAGDRPSASDGPVGRRRRVDFRATREREADWEGIGARKAANQPGDSSGEHECHQHGEHT